MFEWKTWKTLDALDSFHRYWLKSEQLITHDADIEELRNLPDWRPQTESENALYQAEIADIRSFHDYEMKRVLRYGCTTLLYSLVELELRCFVENLDGKTLQKRRNDSLLEAFSRHIEHHHSHRVKAMKEYKSLDELRKVRNGIVHYWGEMNFIDDQSLKKNLLRISDFRGKGILCPETSENTD